MFIYLTAKQQPIIRDNLIKVIVTMGGYDLPLQFFHDKIINNSEIAMACDMCLPSEKILILMLCVLFLLFYFHLNCRKFRHFPYNDQILCQLLSFSV